MTLQNWSGGLKVSVGNMKTDKGTWDTIKQVWIDDNTRMLSSGNAVYMNLTKI